MACGPGSSSERIARKNKIKDATARVKAVLGRSGRAWHARQKAGKMVRFRPDAWIRGATRRTRERLRNAEKAWDSAQTGAGLGGGDQSRTRVAREPNKTPSMIMVPSRFGSSGSVETAMRTGMLRPVRRSAER